jgi:hypothetical protein
MARQARELDCFVAYAPRNDEGGVMPAIYGFAQPANQCQNYAQQK